MSDEQYHVMRMNGMSPSGLPIEEPAASELAAPAGSPAPCHCNCGYRCGGPGVCKLDVMECLQQDEGKHFVKDCGHDFSGPMQDMGDGCSSVVCQKCGISAMGHDMMCGP